MKLNTEYWQNKIEQYREQAEHLKEARNGLEGEARFKCVQELEHVLNEIALIKKQLEEQ